MLAPENPTDNELATERIRVAKTYGHLEEWACHRPAVHGTGRFVGSAWLGERHQRLFAS
ncbi:MAG: hypothetical protein HQ465_21205 [Rhodospirillales bacterium]|nr:hypothetical protein [Rhodospirillales bacterium]